MLARSEINNLEKRESIIVIGPLGEDINAEFPEYLSDVTNALAIHSSKVTCYGDGIRFLKDSDFLNLKAHLGNQSTTSPLLIVIAHGGVEIDKHTMDLQKECNASMNDTNCFYQFIASALNHKPISIVSTSCYGGTDHEQISGYFTDGSSYLTLSNATNPVRVIDSIELFKRLSQLSYKNSILDGDSLLSAFLTHGLSRSTPPLISTPTTMHQPAWYFNKYFAKKFTPAERARIYEHFSYINKKDLSRLINKVEQGIKKTTGYYSYGIALAICMAAGGEFALAKKYRGINFNNEYRAILWQQSIKTILNLSKIPGFERYFQKDPFILSALQIYKWSSNYIMPSFLRPADNMHFGTNKNILLWYRLFQQCRKLYHYRHQNLEAAHLLTTIAQETLSSHVALNIIKRISGDKYDAKSIINYSRPILSFIKTTTGIGLNIKNIKQRLPIEPITLEMLAPLANAALSGVFSLVENGYKYFYDGLIPTSRYYYFMRDNSADLALSTYFLANPLPNVNALMRLMEFNQCLTIFNRLGAISLDTMNHKYINQEFKAILVNFNHLWKEKKYDALESIFKQLPYLKDKYDLHDSDELNNLKVFHFQYQMKKLLDNNQYQQFLDLTKLSDDQCFVGKNAIPVVKLNNIIKLRQWCRAMIQPGVKVVTSSKSILLDNILPQNRSNWIIDKKRESKEFFVTLNENATGDEAKHLNTSFAILFADYAKTKPPMAIQTTRFVLHLKNVTTDNLNLLQDNKESLTVLLKKLTQYQCDNIILENKGQVFEIFHDLDLISKIKKDHLFDSLHDLDPLNDDAIEAFLKFTPLSTIGKILAKCFLELHYCSYFESLLTKGNINALLNNLNHISSLLATFEYLNSFYTRHLSQNTCNVLFEHPDISLDLAKVYVKLRWNTEWNAHNIPNMLEFLSKYGIYSLKIIELYDSNKFIDNTIRLINYFNHYQGSIGLVVSTMDSLARENNLNKITFLSLINEKAKPLYQYFTRDSSENEKIVADNRSSIFYRQPVLASNPQQQERSNSTETTKFSMS